MRERRDDSSPPHHRPRDRGDQRDQHRCEREPSSFRSPFLCVGGHRRQLLSRASHQLCGALSDLRRCLLRIVPHRFHTTRYLAELLGPEFLDRTVARRQRRASRCKRNLRSVQRHRANDRSRRRWHGRSLGRRRATDTVATERPSNGAHDCASDRNERAGSPIGLSVKRAAVVNATRALLKSALI